MEELPQSCKKRLPLGGGTGNDVPVHHWAGTPTARLNIHQQTEDEGLTERIRQQTLSEPLPSGKCLRTFRSSTNRMRNSFYPRVFQIGNVIYATYYQLQNNVLLGLILILPILILCIWLVSCLRCTARRDPQNVPGLIWSNSL